MHKSNCNCIRLVQKVCSCCCSGFYFIDWDFKSHWSWRQTKTEDYDELHKTWQNYPQLLNRWRIDWLKFKILWRWSTILAKEVGADLGVRPRVGAQSTSSVVSSRPKSTRGSVNFSLQDWDRSHNRCLVRWCQHPQYCKERTGHDLCVYTFSTCNTETVLSFWWWTIFDQSLAPKYFLVNISCVNIHPVQWGRKSPKATMRK